MKVRRESSKDRSRPIPLKNSMLAVGWSARIAIGEPLR
jgi:hypothetical protein